MAQRLSTTRSAFTREALRAALECYEEAELEARHQEGYQRNPPSPNEFAVQEQDRAWGDDDGIDTLRSIQIRVPDTRGSGFAEECRRQSTVIAEADAADRGLTSFMDTALEV